MSATINSGVAPNHKWLRPMWNRPPIAAGSLVTATVRPPDQGNAPLVGDVTGLGTGGGAGLGANADSSFGNVRLNIGLAPAASGAFTLTWPVPPPAAANGIAVTADWAAVTQAAPAGPIVDLSFMTPGVLDPRLAYTRASTATYFDNGGVMRVAANDQPRWNYDQGVLRGVLIETSRANSIRNSMMTGAVAGTPGTDPTGWSVGVGATGLVKQIVGTGTENGITYIDYRFTAASIGTAGNLTLNFVNGAGLTTIPASPGQVWTQSLYVSLVAGTLPTNTGVLLRANEFDSGGANIGVLSLIAPVPAAQVLSASRQVASFPATAAGTAFVQPFWLFGVSVNPSPVDFTLRVGGTQFELGATASSFIPTTSVAVTRAVDHCTLTDAVLFAGTSNRTVAFDAWMTQIALTSNMGSLDDTTANNNMRLYCPAAPGIRASVVVGGTTQFLGGDLSPGTRPLQVRAALANGTAWNGSVNGLPMFFTGGPSTPLGPLTTLHCGEAYNATQQLDGDLQRVRVWNRSLGQMELNDLTSAAPQAFTRAVTWTAARTLVPGELVRVPYRWNVSN